MYLAVYAYIFDPVRGLQSKPIAILAAWTYVCKRTIQGHNNNNNKIINFL